MMTNHKKLCIIESSPQSDLRRLPRFTKNLTTKSEDPTLFFIQMMSNFLPSKSSFTKQISIILGLCTTVSAQTAAGESGFTSNIVYIVLVAVAAGIAFFFWRKSKQGSSQSQYDYESRLQNYSSGGNADDGVDAEKELEWFRKAKRSTPKQEKKIPAINKFSGLKNSTPSPLSANGDDLQISAKAFQEKMKKMQYSQLPVNSFLQLAEPREFEPLPLSSDPALISAIEQTNEEFEEDEAVRELAFRILTQFKTRNSVEALSQIALYDLSSNLRSKAVATLTEFDHESVFETILLACADPTREVRAAAARGLFRLSFDRADAWKRIIATKDEFRMRHAARAATESGIAVKSFDRLLHDDMKISYEAFALVGLLIKSGEVEQIFSAIRKNPDERVKFALLHVLSVVRDDRSLRELNKLRIDTTIPEDVAARVKETVENYHPVMA